MGTPGKRQVFVLALLAVLLSPVAGSAQTRNIEVFGMVGISNSTLNVDVRRPPRLFMGTSLGYGGTVMIPLRGSLALDMDIQSFGNDDNFDVTSVFQLNANLAVHTRETVFSPALVYVYRKEDDRAYIFAGAGLGVDALTMTSVLSYIEPISLQPNFFQGEVDSHRRCSPRQVRSGECNLRAIPDPGRNPVWLLESRQQHKY